MRSGQFGGKAALFVALLCLGSGCGRLGLQLLELGATVEDGGSLGSTPGDGGTVGEGEGVGDGAIASVGDAGVDNGCSPSDCECQLALAPLPQAHWMLDEATGALAAEATTTAPTGMLMGFTEPVAWGPGRVQNGLSFDGLDDHVQVGTVAAPVKTVAFWAKTASAFAIQNTSPALFPSSTGPDEDWSSPENAFSVGNGNATANLTLLGTKDQHWGGFHIADHLPAGASVLGITVSLKSASLGVINGVNVELSWDAGASHTDAGYGGVALVGSSDVSTYGGVDQLWGRAWHPEDFADQNFRVRVRLGGLIGLLASVDYVTVAIKYTDVNIPRNILNLTGDAKIAFSGAEMQLAATNWPGATTYVNGVPGAALSGEWCHVVVTSPEAITLDQLQFGDVTSEGPGTAFHGALDEIALFSENVTPGQAAALFHGTDCGP